MPAKDEVRAEVITYIQRVCRGQGNEHEIGAFPEVLSIFLDRYGSKARAAVEVEPEPEVVYAPPRLIDTSFPMEGLVTGEQAAKFLGHSDLKNPASKIRRLSQEGLLPPPVRQGSREFRWYAQDIRALEARIRAGGDLRAS